MKKMFELTSKIRTALSFAYDEYMIDKQKIYSPEQFASFGKDSHIYRKVSISHPNRVVIGDGCTIQTRSVINSIGGLHIGNYVGIGIESMIVTFVHNYINPKSIPYDNRVLLKPVIIRDFVWISWRVSILPGVEIGEGAIVGIGAVVTKNVPPMAIVSGNPATIVGYRSKEKFEECKKNNKVNTFRILEQFGSFDEKIPPFVKKRYEKELKDLKLI